MRPSQFLRVLCLVTGLWLSACSLAEDITPPPGATRIVPVQPTPAPEAMTVLAQMRPSAEVGAGLFAQHCAACHGPLGNGDGEQAAQLPNPPAKLSAPELARMRSPREWFDVVTNGRLDKLMPPFAQSLTAEQRWHLVAFLYTLSTPPSQMETGQAVYSAGCAECHGADGAGVPDLTAPAYFAARTPNQVSAAIAANAAHADLPALAEADQQAVADYVHGFAFEYLAPGAAPPERLGTVAGRVSNGTAGAALPSSLALTLFGVESTGIAITRTAPLNTDGTFQFDEVPYTLNRQFAVSATHAGVAYYSDLQAFAAGQRRLDVPLTIYDTTNDPASLRLASAQTFILFDRPGEATLGQLFLVSNTGDRAFVPSQQNAVQFNLPPEATGLTIPEGEEGVTYIRLNDGVADLRAVPPGEGTVQVFLSYRLPESLGLSFTQAMQYPVDSASVLLGDTTAQLSGAGWAAGGTQDVQGARFIQYRHGGLAAGEALSFSVVRGDAADAPGIAIGAVALAAVGAALFVWWRRRPLTPSAEGREGLLQTLAQLDDDFAAGKLNPERYERQRAELKAALRDIWTKDNGR
jgi:mono/diheme cytochrome c family protein